MLKTNSGVSLVSWRVITTTNAMDAVMMTIIKDQTLSTEGTPDIFLREDISPCYKCCTFIGAFRYSVFAFSHSNFLLNQGLDVPTQQFIATVFAWPSHFWPGDANILKAVSRYLSSPNLHCSQATCSLGVQTHNCRRSCCILPLKPALYGSHFGKWGAPPR